ncbi:MAG: hypothetical protein AM326_12240 [Candidatus Thorarchaeota archaeon SMTZ-45]|nr:MAG: hypothetical protein AM326_12240 [Candidatus Thorarchaeota archaeon SMTZ-45]
MEYLNLSEELWSKRVCEPEEIRHIVDSRFKPLVNDIMYSMVPSRLYEMRGGTLLSLAKPKLAYGTIGVTMAIKNLFGMIPTPYRGKFHGRNDSLLNDSIMDICKTCRSVFNVSGIIEAIFSTPAADELLLKSKIYRDLGFVWGAKSIFELDVLIAIQMGFDIKDVRHLALAAQTFGYLPQKIIEVAKKHPVRL